MVTLLRTPLYALHREYNARIVSFAGYEMPLHYSSGILHEHHHTRERVSLFDVSHMGQFRLTGEGVVECLERMTVGDFGGMRVLRMLYTLLTNEQGGIMDDLMVIREGEDSYLLIVNAAYKESDWFYIESYLGLGGGVVLQLLDDRGLLALQGPGSAVVLERYIPDIQTLRFLDFRTFFLEGREVGISRSGYTGEDGFEMSVRSEDMEFIARLLLSVSEVELAGLGCRDTLRLETGLCLAGQDFDTTTTPIEADLAWTISKRRRMEGGFVGSDRILAQLRDGVSRIRVGLAVDGRIAARTHASIRNTSGTEIGRVTSGTFSPTLSKPISMGYVPPEYSSPGTPVQVVIRERGIPAQITPLPFRKPRYFKGFV